MAFTEVSWSNGETITETKMDQMVASDVHVREEVNYYHLVADACDRTVINSGSGTLSLQLQIDGTGYGGTASSTGNHNESDIDISAVSTGIHVARFVLTNTGSGGNLTGPSYRFYKSADMTYLSWWASVSSAYFDGATTITLYDISIIGHRQIKSWT